MSQKVNIVKVTYEGSPFYLGQDKQNNSMYTRNPERIMEYLCDGQRFIYNCYRAGRERWTPRLDENGNKVYVGDKLQYDMNGYVGNGPHHLLPEKVFKITTNKKGETVESWNVPCIPQESLRENYSFLISLPSSVGTSSYIKLWENTDWNAARKAASTVRSKGGIYHMPGLKRRKKGMAFKIQPTNMFDSYRQLSKNMGEVTISGTLPKKFTKGSTRWKLKIRVRITSPIEITKAGQSMAVNWTKRTLVFVNTPKPIERTNPKPIVGLDRGVKISLATSDRVVYNIPKDKNPEKLKSLQRKMSRQKLYSKNWKRTKAIHSAMVTRDINRRDNWVHETSKDLVKNYDTIVLEDLNTSRMTQKGKKKSKRTLNKNILAANWYKLQTHLEYKAKLSGSSVEFVAAAYTSQACTVCHYVHRDNRKSQSEFECVKCGHADNADFNAANNIYKKFTGELVTPAYKKK